MIWLQVKRSRLCFLRRPRCVAAPYIRPRLKNVGLWQPRPRSSLQMLFKEWKENVLPVKVTGVRSKIDAAKMFAVIARPSPVYPGAYHERIEDPGIVLVDGMESSEWALQIFRIEPATHCQNRAMNVLHMRSQIARLPVIVEGVVPHLIVEKSTLAVEQRR